MAQLQVQGCFEQILSLLTFQRAKHSISAAYKDKEMDFEVHLCLRVVGLKRNNGAFQMIQVAKNSKHNTITQ